ncbi:UNVERIFIED_CONTAM: hypothetical protein GTU68_012701 [Idotea baltica]|nr:hypothetical protein [Idotea baltica]
MNPSIYERHTFYNVIAFSTFYAAGFYSVGQTVVQRNASVSSIREAKRSLVLSIFGMLLIHILIFLMGLILYGAYAGCDPFMEGKISKKEAILSYYIFDKFKYISGLPGLFVATLVASTLR